MACHTGGAEAARAAGYSAKGAKQRGAFMMRQPEIRVRIDHHYHLDHGHPDADLENLDPDLDEEFDGISINRDGKPAAPKASAALESLAKPAIPHPKHPEPKRLPTTTKTRIVTRDSDLSRLLPQSPAA